MLATTNIRSIYYKLSDIFTLIQVYGVKIIAVTETWFTSAISTSELLFHGYSLHRIDRPTHGGGVLIDGSIGCAYMSHLPDLFS